MRDPNAPYDAALNQPKGSQEDVAKAVIDLVNAVRRELSAQDPDSPGKLTAAEILQIAISKVPSAALTIVEHFQNTGNSVQDDVEAIAHVVTRQLGVYDAPTVE